MVHYRVVWKFYSMGGRDGICDRRTKLMVHVYKNTSALEYARCPSYIEKGLGNHGLKNILVLFVT
jgi:hypothetical protein